MIIKGESRGGPVRLAAHLLRRDTNEDVKILQLDSPMGNLKEALRDWQLIAAGTRGSKGLYHANISPDARYVMTPEQWQRTVDVLEQELGLNGQPRAIVFHEKEGRQHVHVVWQRTDIDTMKMVPDSFNYQAHERASLALEQEFGHEHVPGKHAKRDKTQEMPRAEITHAEWQQGERTGIDPREFKDTITAIYKACDNGQAFQAALDERGLIIAKGDRRDYVIVDDQSQVYSLGRQIKGVAAKDLRAFMTDIDRETLPDVEQAKALQHQHHHDQQQQQEAAQESLRPEAKPKEANPAPVMAAEDIERIKAALRERHESELQKWHALHELQRTNEAYVIDLEMDEKLATFDALQKAALDRYERERAAEQRGIWGFIAAMKARLNPILAAEEAKKKAADHAARVNGLAQERLDHIALMQTVRQELLDELAERQAQQLREADASYAHDVKRHLEDHAEAERFVSRLEEARRLAEEQRLENRLSGPDPPKLTQ